MSDVAPESHHITNHITGPNGLALFQRGIRLFNDQKFFECHEVLEEVWTPARGPERLFLQALIHFAVGFYHEQRNNREGAERQLRKGLKKITGYLPSFEGVDTAALRFEVERRLETICLGGKVSGFPEIKPPGNADRNR